MMLIHQVKEDVRKLARLAASVSEAHTAAVFLPTGLLTADPSLDSGVCDDYGFGSHANRDAIPLTNVVSASAASPRKRELTTTRLSSIELVGAYSNSTCLVRDCRIPVGAGLIGWVAENLRPIHVAPFDMDSSTLGIYSDSEAIKSLVAVPITLPTEKADGRAECGVLMCDSRKAVSFSKQQIKQIEEIALQVSRLVFWSLVRKETSVTETTWQSFSYRAGQLAEAIGADSVEVLRISIQNFSDLEATIGLSATVQHTEQFMRLVQQALPPHFPVIRIPNGEILVALDNMMSAFFQQKIRSLAARPAEAAQSGQGASAFSISILPHSAKQARMRTFDIDTLLKQPPTVAAVASPVITSKVVGGSRA
jgi:hypothetical protein